MRWMPNGCAFCIVNTEALTGKVLPKYFKEAKYTSFVSASRYFVSYSACRDRCLTSHVIHLIRTQTRKLNRWGFKHFTMPTSEPGQPKEMSIYTHELFQRDNPGLCQQMDGGHRRRHAAKDPSSAENARVAAPSQGTGGGGAGGSNGPDPQDADALLRQQQNMMMQQMQQLQQQSMLLQQMQQHIQQQASRQTGQGTLDAAATGGGGGGGGGGFNNSMMFGNNASNQGNSTKGGTNSDTFMGMRRTSLGFMPYLPPSSRRDSLLSSFSGAGVASDGFGNSNDGGEAIANIGGGTSQPQSQISEASAPGKDLQTLPAPAPGGTQSPAADNVGGMGSAVEDMQQSQAKLAILEEMIAKERKRQSLLKGANADTPQPEMV